MESSGSSPRAPNFCEVLAEAKSNVAGVGTGADIFAKFVEPLRVTPARIASHLAISSLVEEGDDSGTAGGYRFRRSRFQKQRHGRVRLATSQLDDRANDHRRKARVCGGIDAPRRRRLLLRGERIPGQRSSSKRRPPACGPHFAPRRCPTMLRILQQELGPDEGGLESVLPDGRERISELVFGNVVGNFVDEYGRMYESHQRVLEQLQEAGFELPKELRAAAEFALGRRFMQEIKSAHRSLDPAAYSKAIEIADEALRRGYEIDRSAASHILGEMIASTVTRATESPAPERLRSAMTLVELARRLRADGHLTRAQEIFYQALLDARAGPKPSRPWPLRSGSHPASLGRRESLISQLRGDDATLSPRAGSDSAARRAIDRSAGRSRPARRCSR